MPNEVIIVDDGSTDTTPHILADISAEYPAVTVVRHQRNIGAHQSALEALKMATSEYVIAAATDDFVRETFLPKSLALLQQHPHAALCCTVSEFRAHDCSWRMGVGMSESAGYITPVEAARLARRGKLFIPTNSVVARRDAFRELGFFKGEELQYAADWFAFTKLALERGFCYLPETLAVAEVNDTGLYSAGRKNRAADREIMIKVYRSLTPAMKECESHYVWGWPMVCAADTRSLHFAVNAGWYESKRLLKNCLPSCLVGCMAKWFGH